MRGTPTSGSKRKNGGSDPGTVGESYGDRYYPAISGVAQSYNFYPYYPMQPEEGTVSLALGLGKSIVEGGQVYRFSPAHPQMNPLYSSPEDYLKKSQNAFYALNRTATADITLRADDDYNYEKLPISQADGDEALEYVGSTYSAENDCIYDNVNQPGPKVVTFAPCSQIQQAAADQYCQGLFTAGKTGVRR